MVSSGPVLKVMFYALHPDDTAKFQRGHDFYLIESK